LHEGGISLEQVRRIRPLLSQFGGELLSKQNVVQLAKSGTLEMICAVPAAAASIRRPGTPPQMSPDTAVFVSSTSRTAPLRTIRLDLGLDLLSRHGRRSGYSELLPRCLHLRDAGCREPLAQNRFDRAGLKEAFCGGLLGEGVRNRDLDRVHGIYS